MRASSPSSPTLWERLATARVFDLAQPLGPGIPVSPSHPGFEMALVRRHGDRIRADGGSASNEMMVLGGHTSTHIDALCHVSHCGRLYGGVEAGEAQQGGRFSAHGVETIPLTFCRGVLLDIATLHGVDCLEPGAPVTPQDLEAAAERQRVEVRAGDAVLVRTGWPRHWHDPQTFLGTVHGAPGPDLEAARWLARRKILLTGAETLAYEHIPPGKGHALLPVHRELLVEAGIYILEMLSLGELAAAGISEFLFVLTPLKVEGATGVPVRPVAIVEGVDADDTGGDTGDENSGGGVDA